MKRKLSMEALESRRVLAGNVSASIVNNELRIVGDAAPNWVEVQELAGADNSFRTFRITGKAYDGAYKADGSPQSGTSPTLINGSAVDTIVVPSDKVRISTGAGNDVLKFSNLTAVAPAATVASLNVATGSGRDWASVQRTTVTGATNGVINMGAEAEVDIDYLKLDTFSTNLQGLNLATGGGNDKLVLDTVAVKNALNMSSGGGNDNVSVESLAVQGNTTVNLGAGADIMNVDSANLKAVSVDCGSTADRDVTTITNLIATTVNYNMGGGNDLLYLREFVSISGNVTVNGGAGTADELRVGQFISIGSYTLNSVEIHP